MKRICKKGGLILLLELGKTNIPIWNKYLDWVNDISIYKYG